MRTTLTIPDEIYSQIVSIAKAADQRVSEVVTGILRECIESKPPAPSAGKNDKSPFIPFPATGNTIDLNAVRRAIEEEPFN